MSIKGDAMVDLTRQVTGRPDSAGDRPSARELVHRAVRMRPLLRAQQDDAEARGHYGEEVHNALIDAELYRVLTPRRYGGLEMDLATYARVVIEISCGDPSTGWCYSLGHNHNLTTASHWPVEAQDEVFRHPDGFFRASHSVGGTVEATRADGGYRLTGTSPYQSGVPYAAYVTVNAAVRGSAGPDGAPEIIAALVPRGEYRVLDDWGGDGVLGLRGSGSNTVRIEDVFVPEYRTCRFDWLDHDYDQPSVGNTLHGNPMYLGPVAAFFHLALVAPVVGAARAAIDEYEDILTTRTMPFPPLAPRRDDPLHQADFGMALTMADTAEAIAVRACEEYTEYCEDVIERGIPFTVEKDARLYGVIQRAGELASDAVTLLFRSAGSSAAKAGHPMQRYYRDVSMYRGHVSAQYQWTAMKLAQVHFGLRTKPY
ncbi:MAG TPA: acyl-CoA dehydrogenase family protein [Amycolatopsis sp.]|nr:acyl-CoA dehydrogenase family protein [Amycolatopsis sp.]